MTDQLTDIFIREGGEVTAVCEGESEELTITLKNKKIVIYNWKDFLTHIEFTLMTSDGSITISHRIQETEEAGKITEKDIEVREFSS